MPRTMPAFAYISAPAKIGNKVSESVGMAVALIIVLPSNGKERRSDIVVSRSICIQGRFEQLRYVDCVGVLWDAKLYGHIDFISFIYISYRGVTVCCWW